MNTFIVLFVCVQACFVQNVFGQCFGSYGPAAGYTPGYGPGGFGPAAPGLGFPGAVGDYGYPGLGAPCGGAYGGAGEGNVAVAGELPVAGTTAVAGQVPIMGAVNFCGPVPAAGTVSISGNCACGCGSPYLY